MVLYDGDLDLSRLPQSKYVIVLHSDLLSRVVHFDGPPFFSTPYQKAFIWRKYACGSLLSNSRIMI
jgi:hypothetical protein